MSRPLGQGIAMAEIRPTRKPWTTSDVKRLQEWAGRRPLSEICEDLDRTEASVTSKANELRKNGVNISLRFYRSKLVWCPNCATWRTRAFKKSGNCLVCRLKERVARAERKCEEALAALPDKTRAEFLSKQYKRGCSVPKRIKTGSPCGNLPYDVMKFQAENAIAAERWEVERLRRMANAEKSRLCRIRRKADQVDAGSVSKLFRNIPCEKKRDHPPSDAAHSRKVTHAE